MVGSRLSVRWLLAITLLIGFDCAAMIRAIQQGHAARSVTEYAVGFGLVLLVLNVLIVGLGRYFARMGRGPGGQRLLVTPSPVVIAGLYLAMIAVAILSVLFLSSGRF